MNRRSRCSHRQDRHRTCESTAAAAECSCCCVRAAIAAAPSSSACLLSLKAGGAAPAAPNSSLVEQMARAADEGAALLTSGPGEKALACESECRASRACLRSTALHTRRTASFSRARSRGSLETYSVALAGLSDSEASNASRGTVSPVRWLVKLASAPPLAPAGTFGPPAEGDHTPSS